MRSAEVVSLQLLGYNVETSISLTVDVSPEVAVVVELAGSAVVVV
jgi:hypothetical protein